MRRFIAPVFCALGMLLTGCSSDYKIEFAMDSSPPGYADLSSREMVMEEGLAVAVFMEPFEDGDRMDEETYLEYQMLNSGVMRARKRDVGDRYEEYQERALVLTAEKVGRTSFEIYIYCDEDEDDFDTVEIPVTVLEQP